MLPIGLQREAVAPRRQEIGLISVGGYVVVALALVGFFVGGRHIVMYSGHNKERAALLQTKQLVQAFVKWSVDHDGVACPPCLHALLPYAE